MRVAWHPLARWDLLALVDHIAADNPTAALEVRDRIEHQVGRLAYILRPDALDASTAPASWW